jgi:hypothetical protein
MSRSAPCLDRSLGRQGLAGAVSVLLVCAIFGCEVQEPAPDLPVGPRLYPVRGTVSVDGKPLGRAVVVFMPSFSDAGTHSVGETKTDGTYELAHMGRPGAGRGDYRVTISFIVAEDGKVADLKARSSDFVPPELDHGKELVPPRYSNFSRTELRATIPPGGPTGTIDFDLKGSLREPPGKVMLDEPAQGNGGAAPPGARSPAP